MKKKTHGGKRVGCGRPSLNENEKRVSLTVRIIPRALKILNDCAKQDETSRGRILENAILDYLFDE